MPGEAEQEQARANPCRDHADFERRLTTMDAKMTVIAQRQEEQQESIERVPVRTIELMRQILPGRGADPQQAQESNGTAKTIGYIVAGALTWAAAAGLIPSSQASPQEKPARPPAIEQPRSP